MTFHGAKPNNTTFFHTRGAFHRARWMTKAIYCLNIYIDMYTYLKMSNKF